MWEDDIIKSVKNNMQTRNDLGLANFENIDKIKQGLNIVFMICNHNEHSKILPREKTAITQLVPQTGVTPIYKTYEGYNNKLDF